MKPDFCSPEFIASPYRLYAQMREQAPVYPLAPKTWLLTRYRDADWVLRDGRFGKNFPVAMFRRYGRDVSEEPVFRIINAFLLLMNPPEHTRLRTLISKAFSVRRASEQRLLSKRVAERLVDQWIDRGEADLIEVFAYPLPVRVICTLLGIELEHSLEFQKETQALAKSFELRPLNAAELADANAAALKFERFFREVCRQRRQRPGADLVSLLLQAEEGGDRLHEDEIIANIVLLFTAGHETTANMLGNTLALLFRHPEQLACLRAHPDLIPKVVEESLRFDTSVQFAFRTALEPVMVGDATIEAGDSLYLALGAANRDPEVFAQPECFLLDRPDETTKALAFGGGGHYCLGARLARIELETALEVLFRRLPGLTVENRDQLKWKPAFAVRGLESLPARW